MGPHVHHAVVSPNPFIGPITVCAEAQTTFYIQIPTIPENFQRGSSDDKRR